MTQYFEKAYSFVCSDFQ